MSTSARAATRASPGRTFVPSGSACCASTNATARTAAGLTAPRVGRPSVPRFDDTRMTPFHRIDRTMRSHSNRSTPAATSPAGAAGSWCGTVACMSSG
ncbi:hypothetical protein DVH21_01905 [Micromonospora aurantiaca]|uniref:Uncharacterized protein n=1 Tax=Micromonospora aurantiaca (nom. illeg.) TaxID=47850 RepID=A0A6N3JV50_9ACTN|nr:hypothetical protein DVH21_01905 [Micromonospora aurantiaca]